MAQLPDKITHQLVPHRPCSYTDQEINLAGFRGSFITVQICSTFSPNPIHTPFPEEFDTQIKLDRPD